MESPGANIDKVFADIVSARQGLQFTLTHTIPEPRVLIPCCNGSAHYYRAVGQVFICRYCCSVIPVPVLPAFEPLRYGNGKPRGGRKKEQRKGLMFA